MSRRMHLYRQGWHYPKHTAEIKLVITTRIVNEMREVLSPQTKFAAHQFIRDAIQEKIEREKVKRT